MKILIVNKFLFPNGGSETYIFNLGKELEKKGHRAEYFGMEHPGRIVGNSVESYTSSMDFHGGGLQKLLYPFKIIYSREAGIKIRAVLEAFEPDVVHLNNFNFQITPSVIYEIRRWGKEKGRYIPIVYTAHDYQWVCPNHMMYIPGKNETCFQCEGGKFGSCFKNRCIHGSAARSLIGAVEGGLYRRLGTYGKVDLIICPSRFMKEKLETDKNLKGRLEVLYNFLETPAEKEACEKKDYVLYFGRYTREKGLPALIAACRDLPDIPFVFAGSGEMEDELNSCRNIKNLGFLGGEKLKSLISGAKFSVFPSQWYENCPFSVMESQAYGTPVIAADIGGVPELLEDGATGELFEPGNAQELKNKIRDLWNNSGKLRAYTDNCWKKKFTSPAEYVDVLLNLYEKLQRIEMRTK